jgi:uncharacterized protein YbjT (DUF2867 family)
MADRKIVAVLGATGAQGGGLARAILADPAGGFAARAITRDASSDKARALADAGADVVEADVDDEASLRKAFEGAHGAFCVTFYWAHMSPEKELAQATAMARAARATGVSHAIWSTLEDTRRWVPLHDGRIPTLMGKYKVPHFDSKGEADQVFRDTGVPTTFLLTSFYWENFIFFGMAPKAGADGTLAITLPMGDQKLPSIAVEDIGRSAYAIFKGGSRYLGQTVGIAGAHMTGGEMAAAFARVLERPVVYNAIEPEVFRGFGFPGADDLANMFQFNRDFSADFCAARDLAKAHALHPGMLTFDQWLADNIGRIPIE